MYLPTSIINLFINFRWKFRNTQLNFRWSSVPLNCQVNGIDALRFSTNNLKHRSSSQIFNTPSTQPHLFKFHWNLKHLFVSQKLFVKISTKNKNNVKCLRNPPFKVLHNICLIFIATKTPYTISILQTNHAVTNQTHGNQPTSPRTFRTYYY